MSLRVHIYLANKNAVKALVSRWQGFIIAALSF
jgi:hypothetical protein